MRAGITGLGVVSAAGAGVDAFTSALSAGGQGARPVERYDVRGFRCPVAALVPDDAGSAILLRHGLGEDERASAWLWEAADEALVSAGLPRPADSGRAVGVFLGTSAGEMARWERYHAAAGQGDDPSPGPSGTGYGGLAERLGRRLGATGPVVTVTTACCSSTGAIGLARDAVLHGDCEIAVAGGADALTRFVHAGFESLRALSERGVEPFGADRDGLQLGEGAGIVVIEAEHALRSRGARALAWLDGFGLSGDAFHLTAPRRDGGGVEAALRAALEDAGLCVDDVDLVNAHATGTPFNDAAEAKALARLFAGRPVAVNAVKQRVGHALGAAGALEVVMGVVALDEGRVPGALLRGEPDPEAPPGLVLGPERRMRVRVFATTNSAFAGNNAALVLSREAA